MSRNSSFNLSSLSNVQSNSISLARLVHYQTNRLPLYPVPSELWIVIINSKIEFPRQFVSNPNVFEYQDSPYTLTPFKEPILLPKADEIGTEFVKEMLPIKYTNALIDFLSSRSKMLSSSSEADSAEVGYSVDIMKLFQKEDAGTISAEYQKQWTKAFSYFLDNQARKHELADEEFKTNLKYWDLVAEAYYSEETKTNSVPLLKRIGKDSAKSLLQKWNGFINDKIDNFFKDIKEIQNSK